MSSKISLPTLIDAVTTSINELRNKDTFDRCRAVCIETRALMSAADEEVLFTRKVDDDWRTGAEKACEDALGVLKNSAHAKRCDHMIRFVEQRLMNIRSLTLDNVEHRLSAIA